MTPKEALRKELEVWKAGLEKAKESNGAFYTWWIEFATMGDCEVIGAGYDCIDCPVHYGDAWDCIPEYQELWETVRLHGDDDEEGSYVSYVQSYIDKIEAALKEDTE